MMDFAEAYDVFVAEVEGKWCCVVVVFDGLCAVRVGAFAVGFLVNCSFDAGGNGAGGNFGGLGQVGRKGQ